MLSVGQIVTEHPFRFQSVNNLIFCIEIKLSHTPGIFHSTGQIIIQPGKVRTRVCRGHGWILRIVICKRTDCRQVSVCTKKRQPIVVTTRHTRIHTLFDTTVHSSAQLQFIINLRFDVHLYIGTGETSVINDHCILVKVTQTKIIVYLV